MTSSLGYMTEPCLPFKKDQFVLMFPSADLVKVSSLADSSVKRDVSKDKVVALEKNSLLLKSDSPLSLAKFINQLIGIGSDQLFSTAYKQGILDKAKKVHILHLAASAGSGATLTYLMAKYPEHDVTERDSAGNNLLHSAVVNKANVEVMEMVLNASTHEMSARDDANSDSSDDSKNLFTQTNNSDLTPLLLAITEDCPKSVAKLIAAGAPMQDHGQDGDKNTALHLAAKLNSVACLKAMCDNEGAVDEWKKLLMAKNKMKMIPVMLTEDSACIQILLKHAEIEKAVSDELGPILHWASGCDKLNLVSALLSLPSPAKVDKKNSKGFSPLKISAKRGFARIVEALLKGGADPNFIGKDVGFTALNNAAQYGQLEAVKVLVNHEAKLSHESMTNTALHSAVYGGQADIVRYLLKECGMSPDILNNAGRPPLFQAIGENQPDCLKLLLEYNAILTTPVDTKKSTPLHMAVEKGEIQMAKMLLEHGSRPEESNTDGITPLMLTTKEDHASLIPLIMSYGIAIAKVDNDKNTVMHHAATNGAVNCVDYLVKRIAKMSGVTQQFQIFKSSNSDKKTPFDIALELKQESVLAIFIKYAPEDFFVTNAKCLHQMFDSKMYQTLKAIFDIMAVKTDGEMNVTVKFLDSNAAGQYPEDSGYNHMIPSLLHKLLSCPEVTLKYHPIVSVVVSKKLVIYRWWYIMSFIFYVIFLLALSYALVQASYLCDDKLLDYNGPFNVVRLLCELFCVLCWFLFLIDEVIEFIIEWVQIRHEKSDKEGIEHITITKSEGNKVLKFIQEICNVSKMFHFFDRNLFYFPSAILNYWIGFNIVDSGALICFVILFFLRIVRSYFQWTFASFTFILFALRLFKYTRIIPALGAYVRSVFRVFVHDIPRFIVIVLILSISYLGGIHLAARQQPHSLPQTVSLNSEICTNASHSQLFWFNDMKTLNYDLRKPLISSIIFLLDGGPGNVEDDLLNVNFVFVILYIVFAFTIIVVLLNILIAQLSETYSEIIKTNESHYKMELVVNLELKSNLAFITGKIFRKYNTIDSLDIPLSMWEDLKISCPGKSMEQQVEEINEKLKGSELIIREEAQKASYNHEWVQEKISKICDCISEVSGVGEVKKSPASDPVISARITGIETKVNSLERKIDKILTVLQAKS